MTNELKSTLVIGRLKLHRVVQEAQLMLANPRDAFRGQSRSPNIVLFHILGIVSYVSGDDLYCNIAYLLFSAITVHGYWLE